MDFCFLGKISLYFLYLLFYKNPGRNFFIPLNLFVPTIKWKFLIFWRFLKSCPVIIELHYYMFAIKYLQSNYFTETLNANQPTSCSSLHFLRTNVNQFFRNSVHFLQKNNISNWSSTFLLLVKCSSLPHFLILLETISSEAYLWLLFNEEKKEKKRENTRDSIKAPITIAFF